MAYTHFQSILGLLFIFFSPLPPVYKSYLVFNFLVSQMPQVRAMTDLPWVGILNARLSASQGRGEEAFPASSPGCQRLCFHNISPLEFILPSNTDTCLPPFPFPSVFFFFSFSLSFFPFLPSFLFCPASLRERCGQQLFSSSCFFCYFTWYIKQAGEGGEIDVLSSRFY